MDNQDNSPVLHDVTPVPVRLPVEQAFNSLAESLANAQNEIVPPKKNRHVDFTHNGKRVKYSYADLADVIEALKIPFAKFGLSVTHQMNFSQNKMFGLTTTIFHKSGQCISTWYPLPDPMKNQIKPQEFGSALTYARRYSLSSLAGIASDEDDDGATGADSTPPAQVEQKREPMRMKKELPNAAPGATQPDKTEDLDAAFGNPPPSEEEFNNELRNEAGNEILKRVAHYGLDATYMKELLNRITASNRTLRQLTLAEMRTVNNYLHENFEPPADMNEWRE